MRWPKVPKAERNKQQHKANSIATHCGCKSGLQVKVQNFGAVNQKMPMLQLYVIDFEPWRQQCFHNQTPSVKIHKKHAQTSSIHLHPPLIYLPTCKACPSSTLWEGMFVCVFLCMLGWGLWEGGRCERKTFANFHNNMFGFCYETILAKGL